MTRSESVSQLLKILLQKLKIFSYKQDGDSKSRPPEHCTAGYRNFKLQLHVLLAVTKIAGFLQCTVTLPIEAADTIQNLCFKPSNFHIKTT